MMARTFRRGSGRRNDDAGMIRTLTISAALAAAVLTAGMAPAAAQNFDPRSNYTAEEARNARQSGDVLPVREVIEIVRREFPGARVLDVELVRTASPHYVVKILNPDGRRMDVRVDARSGRIMSAR